MSPSNALVFTDSAIDRNLLHSIAPGSNIVFIDSNVPDLAYLAKGVIPGTEVIILEPERDGIKQITQALNSYSYPVSLHIVSHGSPGCLYLGNSELSLDTLDNYKQDLKTWFPPSPHASLSSPSPHTFHTPYSLLIYGCSVAAGDAGAEFITKLRQLTGAEIAASTTPTGNTALGGNWKLEYATSTIETSIAFNDSVQQNWQGILAVDITRVSADTFFIDVNDNVTSNYAAYKITNTGGDVNDLWVEIDNFNGGIVGLAPNESNLVNLGALAGGESKTAFFYLQSANTPTTDDQTHDVTAYEGNPTAGGVSQGSSNFILTEVDGTISANANKVNSITISPNPPTLGENVTVTVEGETGTIGKDGILSFTPASFADWDADAYELIDTAITFDGGTIGTVNNQLYIETEDKFNIPYTATYTFKVSDIASGDIQFSPIGNISSGNQLKHTSTGNFGDFDPIQPPSTSNPTVELSVTPDTGSEADTTIFTITATASAAVSGEQTIDLGVTGVDLSDYNLSANQITIADGQTTGSVTLTVVDDNAIEGEETATLTISNPSAGLELSTTTTANVTITDNDTVPSGDIEYTIATSQLSIDEGESGSQTIEFTVTRSGAIEDASSIDFSIAGTAINGEDYNNIAGSSGATGVSGTIDFAANETSKTITLDVTGDTSIEPAETIIVTLANGTAPNGNASIAIPSVTTIIQDDDGALAPDLNIGDTSATEGEPLIFDLSLSEASNGDITLDLTTTNGTADNSDREITNFEYKSGNGKNWKDAVNGTEVTIPDGKTSIQVRIDSVGDSVEESDETFTLAVNNVVSGNVGDTSDTGEGTILDDDGETSNANKGTITGRVWNDTDLGGIQDTGENGVDNVTVKLFLKNDKNNPIATTITSNGGNYEFIVDAGDYFVEFTAPENSIFSPKDKGNDDTLDSDVNNKVKGTTKNIKLSAGETIQLDAGVSPDSDGDTIPDAVEGLTGDRDNDGTPNYLDVDPAGYFYAQNTGQVLSGGLIEVTSDTGVGLISITDDANATGFYQWFIDGTPDIYTMSITAPPGYVISPDRLPLTPALDATPLTPDPFEMGSSKNETTGALFDFTEVNNPYYLEFDLALGDPFIINNNIPFVAPPTLDLDQSNDSGAADPDSQTTFVSGSGGVAIAIDPIIGDLDGTTIKSATITLTNAQLGDILSGANLPTGTSISVDTGNSTDTEIRLTGTGTLAEYQAAIASIEFNNTEASPNTSDRTVTVVVNDGDIDSNTATSTIAITNTALPPLLTIEKSVQTSTTGGSSVNADIADSTAPDVTAGETVTYSAVVQHASGSTENAHDVVIEDLILDPDLTLVPTSVKVLLNGTVIADSTTSDPRVTIDSGNTAGDTNVRVTYVGEAGTLQTGVNGIAGIYQSETEFNANLTDGINFGSAGVNFHGSQDLPLSGDPLLTSQTTGPFSVNGNDYSFTFHEGTFDTTGGGTNTSAKAATTVGDIIGWSGSTTGTTTGSGFIYEANSTDQGGASIPTWGYDTDNPINSTSNTVALFDLKGSPTNIYSFSLQAGDFEGGNGWSNVVAVYDTAGNLMDEISFDWPAPQYGDGVVNFVGVGSSEAIGYVAFFVGDDDPTGFGFTERIAVGDFQTGSSQLNTSSGGLAPTDILTVEYDAVVSSTTGVHTNTATVDWDDTFGTGGTAGTQVTDDANVEIPPTTASLGDRIFLDTDGDGIQDSGESGVSGVTVTLTDGGTDGLISTTGDNSTTTTATDADGNYSFTGLTPGSEYQVSFDLPTGAEFTKANASTDETIDSDADASGVTPIVTLTAGENNQTIAAGIYQPPSLEDKVFLDTDGDGIQDVSESGVSGITVTLTDGGTDGLISTTGDNSTATVTTDSSGNYSFTGLTPGVEYQVSFDLPAGAEFTQADASTDEAVDSDANASGVTPIVTLTSGENNQTIAAGIYQPPSLVNRVFLDTDGDGIQDSGESGVSGVVVTLTGGGTDGLISTTGDNSTATVTTDSSGNYSFTGLTPGAEYQVSFDLPAGTEFTIANASTDETIDSDADASGVTPIVTLTSGENNQTIAAGIYQPPSLASQVFIDSNNNGIQDTGESGLSGVTVTLVGGGDDGLISTTVDNTTATTTTDSSGNYSFTGLTPGVEYQVSFDKTSLPSDAEFIPANVGSDETIDSDADVSGVTPIVTLSSGENNQTIAAGIIQPASVGDRIFLDSNGDGIIDGSETGVSGVRVTLTDGGTDGLISTTVDNSTATVTTDSSGNYSFTGLTPGAEYQVSFDLPAGAEFTIADASTDETRDSDADASGVTPIVTLTSGENNQTIAAGIYQPPSLGDRIFLDSDGDGIIDGSETGVSGVRVTLTGGGTDGLISTTGDNSTATVTTDASGNYSFTGLTPGSEYQVSFDLPAGAEFTIANASTDETIDSDANASGVTPIVTLTSGESNQTIAAGIYQPPSLGDRIFLDSNGDGIQDSGESGVSGVRVTLTGGGTDGLISTTGDNSTATVATDASGNYSFTGLTPGVEYQVSFDLPAGAEFTIADASTDETRDSDADASGVTPIVTLTSGENNQTIAAGIYQPASIGDRVFFDENKNGIQDTGESGVSGVTVTLTGGGTDGLVSTTGDKTTITVATDASGNYSFTGLTPGAEYQVSFEETSLPTDYQFTNADASTDETIDSDADSSGITPVITLTSGENNTSIAAGIYQPVSIGAQVFIDSNGNGVQDSGEAGVSGVRVTLVSGGDDGLISTTGDNTTITTVTDSSGNYLFSDLNPGAEYQVTFDPSTIPADHQFVLANVGSDESVDSDANASGVTPIVTLTSGEENNNIDAGIVKPASLGDTVFFDTNGNGIQDSGELGVSGVVVTLTGGGDDGLISTTGDNTTVTTTTDADGNYSLTGLTPGAEYQVSFNPNSLPFNHQFTQANASTDETIDSDADSSGITPVITLTSGENNQTIAAGIYQLASLGDKVFLDNNGDGFQDSGELGVSGVVVTLTGGGDDGLISTTGDNTTATVTTNSGGNYSFTGLTPGGEYQVSIEAPAGAEFTTPDIFSNAFDSSDSDVNASGVTPIITLTSGEDNETIDAGIYQPPSIEAQVFIDSNNNGIQDSGESGVSGVIVTLTGGGEDRNINTPVDNTTVTTTTNSDGNYSFTGLTPGVEYQVSFDKTSLPGDAEFIRANVGSDESVDSDADSSGVIPVITLTSGEENNHLDAGIIQPGSVGDTVFLDNDGDGIRAPGELGVSGVRVTLTAGGTDGLISTTVDNSTTTITTDSSGNYSFTGLTPGVEYQVSFDNLPANHQFTQANVGSDETVDSDADSSGITPVVTLTSGENNQTIAAGIYQPTALGDRVFLDSDGDGLQDSGELGVSGVRVTLTDGGTDGIISTTVDNTTATITTDADGNYSFTGLTPGVEYQVSFDNLPANHQFTTADVGSDETVDSDADSSGVTPIVTLSSGENNQTIAAGIYQPTALGDKVFLDSDGDGIQDSGESGVSRVRVTLTDGGADGLISTTGDNSTATTTTDSSGNYSFTGLTPGVEYQVSFDNLPANYQFTTADVGSDETVDSDADSSGVTPVVTLTSGENNQTIAAGIYQPTALGDRVFLDSDGDGLQDSGELGVSGVRVTLTAGGADGIISTTVDNTTATTTTDSSGNYSFTGLTPGVEYQVSFDNLPANHQFTTPDVGSDETVDSDADSSGVTPIVTLTSGENNQTIAAGIYQPTALGDKVFLDSDGDGLQDSGELGVSGVRVTLTDGGADGIISTTVDNTTATITTDADGNYSFTGLTPGVEYQVSFDNLPANHQFTTADVGSDETVDSDADSSGVTPVVTLTSGENNQTIAAGIYTTASVGDTVFLDTDGDGILDESENGIINVKVTLTGGGSDGLISTTGDNTTATTITNISGNYSFTGLTPGVEYQVSFDASNLPGNAQFTTTDAGSDETQDSDADSSGLTPIVTFSSGENNTSLDAGIIQPSSLGNQVFLDSDGDGFQDGGELGVSGVTVLLTGGGDDGLMSTTGDNTTITTTTNASGNYSFTGLTPGVEYQLSFDNLPEGAEFTTADIFSNAVDNLDSDANSSGLTPIVTLSSAENNTSIDAGIYQPPSLGDTVFIDRNNNGVQDSGESGFSGVSVTLTGGGTDGLISNTTDNTTITTTTNASGNYSFTGLTPGVEYQVSFDLPAGSEFTTPDASTDETVDSDANASGITPIVTLTSGENNTSIDAGIIQPASLGDTVFLDRNNNGIQDSGESGFSGVSVTLTGGGTDGLISTTGDNTTITTTTNTSGNYSFTGLTPATEYQVSFDLPAGSEFTTTNVGSDETVDSDADASGVTPIVTLTSGENNPTIDAGIIQPASLGDTVFLDSNGDGFQDGGEPGVSGILVTLTGGGTDGLISTTADNTTITTTTNADGNYSFTGLTPATEYQVSFDLPADSEFTTPDIFANGLDEFDSDADASGVTPIVTLTSGENNPTIDAGLLQPASLGDLVFLDSDADGLQDVGESGVSGVRVTLTGGGSDGLISTTGDNTTVTTTTNSSGHYSFTGLNPGSEYQLTFDKNTLPLGTQFTEQNVFGNNFDSTDSDANAVGVTEIITLASGENNPTLDAGLSLKNVVTGTDSAEVINATTGADLIIAHKGEDTLTGGAGRDAYFFNETSDGVDTITDFVPTQDQIDLSNILATEVTAYTGGDPFAQGFVELTEFTHPLSGITSTLVQIDFDAGNELYPKDLVVLQGVPLSSLDSSRDFII